MKAEAIYRLLRLRPTVAWSVCGFILAVSLAINEFGYDLNWDLLALSLLVAVIIQGIIAHAINDVSDEEVDKNTDIKGTSRFKVIISGLMSRDELIVLSLSALSVTSIIGWYIFYKLGIYIFVFYAVGLYAAIAYSLPSMKLGWRPFSEWTVIFPTLLTYVVAINFVATGSLSMSAVYYGTAFSLFNVVWFIISRAMDYYPDKEAGKNTTAVKYGLEWILRSYLPVYIMGLKLFFLFSISVKDIRILLYLPFWAFVMLLLPSSYSLLKHSREYIEKSLSKTRVNCMYISIICSLVISIILVLFR